MERPSFKGPGFRFRDREALLTELGGPPVRASRGLLPLLSRGPIY